MATPQQGMATMIANLKEKTGQSLEQWVKKAKASGESKHLAIIGWLKKEHRLTHGYAALIARTTLSGAASGRGEDGDALVAAQYAGPKAALRPILDALIRTVTAFGDDVEVSPKKTYISLRRAKQFALVQPSSATRIDVGIQLKGVPATARLEPSGSFNQMVSHRVRVESPKDVNPELKKWLKQAYDAAL